VTVIPWEFPSLEQSLKTNQIEVTSDTGAGLPDTKLLKVTNFHMMVPQNVKPCRLVHRRQHSIPQSLSQNNEETQTAYADLPISGKKTAVPEVREIYC
jgi:hypothetical protein